MKDFGDFMKKTLKILICVIVVILSILGILYLIDMNRIKNNEPVFFSTWGQKYAPPVITALIMSLESVFAVIGGMWLLGETLTTKEGIGCFIMIFAIILAQLNLKFRKFTFARLFLRVYKALGLRK